VRSYHAVQEFNRGVFDYLIATDESGLEGHDRDTNEEDEAAVEAEGSGRASTLSLFLARAPLPSCSPALTLASLADTVITTQPSTGETDAADAPAAAPAAASSSKKRKRSKDGSGSSRPSTSEYGVSRGVDFVDVACVINFDLPFSSRSYTHRVGRTARAGRTGTSLSFVVPRDQWGKQKKNDVSLETARYDEKVWARIDKAQRAKAQEVKEYRFDLKQVEGFRYRMEDGLRSVTKAAVREARIKEIKNEVLNSEKLKVRLLSSFLSLSLALDARR